MDIPGVPAPWLHRHPSEQRLPSYYGPVRQQAPQLVLNASGFRRWRAPSRSRGIPTPAAISTLAFSRSVQEPQTRLTPPLRRTPPGQERGHPPGSFPEGRSRTPGFDAISDFRRLNDDARPGHPGRALLERLPGPHLTRSSRAFSLDARHDSLQLTQHQGSLTPTPVGPTPEGRRSSISRTAPPMKMPSYTDPPSAFVTHTPRHLGVNPGLAPHSGGVRSQPEPIPRGTTRSTATTPLALDCSPEQALC